MKTLIAVPCLDMMHTEFVRAFTEMKKPDGTSFAFIQSTLIHEARNLIAQNAVKDGFDRVLWLDSDIVMPDNALYLLSAQLDGGKDFVSGLYFKRKGKPLPVVYSKVEWGMANDGNVSTYAESIKEIPYRGAFEIEGAGFGCCMTSARLLTDMVEKYGSPFSPLMGMGEDLTFCWRARKNGFRLYCDSRVSCGHIGQYVYGEADYRRMLEQGRREDEQRV